MEHLASDSFGVSLIIQWVLLLVMNCACIREFPEVLDNNGKWQSSDDQFYGKYRCTVLLLSETMTVHGFDICIEGNMYSAYVLKFVKSVLVALWN